MSPGDGIGELRLSESCRPDNETVVARGTSPSVSNRLVGLSGLLSFDLIVIAIFVAPPLWNAPPTLSSAETVAVYTGRNATRITLSLFLFSLAMGLFICFAAGLWSWFRQQEPAPKTFSSILGLAGIALAVLILAGFVPIDLLGYRSEPASIAGLLADLTFGLLAVSGLPTAAFLGAYTALVLRLRCLPMWTAYIAGSGAIAHVLIAASFLSHGSFLSLESGVIIWVPATFFVWILATAAVMFRGHSTSAPGSRWMGREA
jgi:hypothetical protein